MATKVTTPAPKTINVQMLEKILQNASISAKVEQLANMTKPVIVASGNAFKAAKELVAEKKFEGVVVLLPMQFAKVNPAPKSEEVAAPTLDKALRVNTVDVVGILGDAKLHVQVTKDIKNDTYTIVTPLSQQEQVRKLFKAYDFISYTVMPLADTPANLQTPEQKVQVSKSKPVAKEEPKKPAAKTAKPETREENVAKLLDRNKVKATIETADNGVIVIGVLDGKEDVVRKATSMYSNVNVVTKTPETKKQKEAAKQIYMLTEPEKQLVLDFYHLVPEQYKKGTPYAAYFDSIAEQMVAKKFVEAEELCFVESVKSNAAEAYYMTMEKAKITPLGKTYYRFVATQKEETKKEGGSKAPKRPAAATKTQMVKAPKNSVAVPAILDDKEALRVRQYAKNVYAWDAAEESPLTSKREQRLLIKSITEKNETMCEMLVKAGLCEYDEDDDFVFLSNRKGRAAEKYYDALMASFTK